jgi:hypothetical protein
MVVQLPVQIRMMLAVTAFFCTCALSAQADLVKLSNGGELRGKVIRVPGDVVAKIITIETLTGVVVKVSRVDVRFVTYRRMIVEEYDTRARATADTLDAQWALAEWCRTNRLIKERKIHLLRVVEFDSNHEAARRLLQHVQYKGEWMPKEQAMAAKGYIKYKNRYITSQELELIEKTAAERDLEQGWFKDVRSWVVWLNGRHAGRRKTGLQRLRAVRDPHAVAALKQFLGESENRALRGLYVDILAQIPGSNPVGPLLTITLEDADYELRYKALNAIDKEQYAAARPYLLKQLKSDSSGIVRRAGAALGRVGDESVVPFLIDALVTSHKKLVRVPSKNSTMSFGSNGSFGPGAGQAVLPPEVERLLRTGQLPYGVQVRHAGLPNQHKRTKLVRVKYESRNTEVYASLQRLTGQKFGYDERTWRLWWAARKSNPAEYSLQ